jgi:hypothetical protein
VDPQRRPVAGARVELFFKPTAVSCSRYRPWKEDPITDLEGRFKLTGVVPGLKYEYVAVMNGPQGGASRGCTAESVVPGQTKEFGDVTISLPK